MTTGYRRAGTDSENKSGGVPLNFGPCSEIRKKISPARKETPSVAVAVYLVGIQPHSRFHFCGRGEKSDLFNLEALRVGLPPFLYYLGEKQKDSGKINLEKNIYFLPFFLAICLEDGGKSALGGLFFLLF